MEEKNPRERVYGLTPATAAALRQAALLGPEFTAADLQVVAGLTAIELIDVVDAGLAAGLLVDSGQHLVFQSAQAWRLLYGQPPGRGDRRKRPATGWGALTPAELNVAGLLAAGYSNPEIAAALYLSRNTVQSHVSHILAKLGARSRAQVAGMAARYLEFDGCGEPSRGDAS